METFPLESGPFAGYVADVFELEDRARTKRPHGIPLHLLEKKSARFFTPHLGSALDDFCDEIALEVEKRESLQT